MPTQVWNPMSQSFVTVPTQAEFLLARFAEDEAAAREAVDLEQRYFNDPQITLRYDWARLASHASGGISSSFVPGAPSPSRVLAEIDAKRRIVALHEIEVRRVEQSPFDPQTGERREPEHDVYCSICGWASLDGTSACETLRLLALPYADHPDFRPEWRQ